MLLIKCLECNHEVSDQAEKCPSCGVQVQKPSTAQGAVGLIQFIVAIIGILVVISIVI